MDYGKPIIVRIRAVIRRREPSRENPDPILLEVEGKAGPHVSSGSMFASSTTHKSVEEAKKHLGGEVEGWRRWFSVYGRPVRVKLSLVDEVGDDGSQGFQHRLPESLVNGG